MLNPESFQNRPFPLTFNNKIKAKEENKLHIQKCQLARGQHFFNHQLMPSPAPDKLSLVGAFGTGRCKEGSLWCTQISHRMGKVSIGETLMRNRQNQQPQPF